MKRLTTRDEFGNLFLYSSEHERVMKLEQYENLGYEPKELKEKLEIYKQALEKIATRKMSEYLTVSHMSNDFIKIATSALVQSEVTNETL